MRWESFSSDKNEWAKRPFVVFNALRQNFRDHFRLIVHLHILEGEHSAEIGDAQSQYALGRFLQRQGRMSEAASWYECACESGNQYAQYRLANRRFSASWITRFLIARNSFCCESGSRLLRQPCD